MLRYVVLAICAMVVSACQSPSPSGLKPKEYLFNAPFVDTKAALTSAFADSNYQVASDNGTTLVLDRPAQAGGGGSADDRISMKFLGDDPTKVTFSGAAAGSSSFAGNSDTTDTAEFREAVAQAAAKAAVAVKQGQTPGTANQALGTGDQTSSMAAPNRTSDALAGRTGR